jgi:Rrf2 family protein
MIRSITINAFGRRRSHPLFVTRQADYAVRCALHLARERKRIVSRREIALAVRAPGPFLAKILHRLLRARVVESVRGVQGGFRLARPPAAISLLDVLEAIQGPQAANVCAIRPSACALSRTCVVHPVWVDLQARTEKLLRGVSLAALAARTRGPSARPGSGKASSSSATPRPATRSRR